MQNNQIKAYVKYKCVLIFCYFQSYTRGNRFIGLNILGILTFVGAGYAVIPMLFTLVFMNMHTIMRRKHKDNLRR